MGSRHGDEVRNQEAWRGRTKSWRDTDPRSCHSMWVAEGAGRGLEEAWLCAPLLALLFVHVFSLSVCLRTGPRPTPGEEGNSGKEGASTP